MADALAAAADHVLAANAADVARARQAGTSEALIDRLALTQVPHRRHGRRAAVAGRPARPGR